MATATKNTVINGLSLLN